MARLYNATTDRISVGTRDAPSTGSISFWVNPSWAQTDGVDHVFFDNRKAGTAELFRFQKFSDNTLYMGWFTGGVDYRVSVASAGYTLNTGAWNHFAYVWTGGTDSELYLNGASIGTKGTNAVWGGADTARVIGNVVPAAGNTDVRGSMAHVAIYTRRLTADEIVSLAGRAFPSLVAPGALQDFWPLWGVSDPEPNLAGGTAGTLTSVDAADGPGQFMPPPPSFLGLEPEGVPGAYNIASH